ncbi:MAG: F0F1 ATP synthase subunit B [Clostridiales bacterium]|nr:F0F1 ATP synthase subunit B [Clostridiales bacterium]
MQILDLIPSLSPIAASDGSGFTPFITIELGTIIFVLLNLLIIYLLFKKFLFERVQKILDARQNDVQAMYTDAETAKENALSIEADYTEKLSQAKDEANELVRSATKRAQIRGEEIVNEAKEQAGHIKKRAEEDIEREKKRAINQIKDEISDIAIDAASKIAQKEINAADQEKLIEEFISM